MIISILLMSRGITGTPQAGRDGLPIPVQGGIKARTKRYADRVRIIRAEAARGEVRYKAADGTGTATQRKASGKN